MIATTQQNMTTELVRAYVLLFPILFPPLRYYLQFLSYSHSKGWTFLVNISVVLVSAPDTPCTALQQDLGSSDGPPRNWKGIGIAMVVIVAVMSLVILSVILLTPENEVAVRTREGHVLSFSLNSNLTATLLDNSSLDLSTTKFQVSADKSFVLLAYNIQPAYVFDGDIYYKPSVTGKPLRLTTTERGQRVANGISDWTYEEEVLLSYVAHWWSMDGARLAYLSINNSATPVMEVPQFLGGLYPSNMLFPYPKAGSSIPSVSLFVVNLYGPAHTLEMMPPDSLRTRESYISMVTWISSTRLAVRWLNRAQNQSVLCVCEATTGACSEKHKMAMDIMQNQRQDVPLFSADGSVFYTILPAKQGARGEFHHVAGLSAQVRFFSAEDFFHTFVSSSYHVQQNTGYLHLKLSLPRGYEANLHPLLIIVDGVPGSQSVTEEFALDWPQVLSSSQNVALAWVDGRSGVGRGQRTAALDPRKLGALRVKDLLGVVELLMQLPYIDDRRMALYGKTASLLEEVNKLKDENFLILHGTADARVHFQHSAELLSRLVKVEANYSLQLYPDEGHDLREPRSVQHFQRTVVNYLHTCLRQSALLEPAEHEDEEED
ncbi:hypothetical protein F2P81_011177 [Scophthalmus maximus]|uniref:Inactive dipeptidyl peptidase 10-like n=1 Tax=Scophthalmus maximus TaxID=52904 RepID=A0A6A4ST77_SCOMX|nr:hypothetical protein F2P81_011177 [Scophthalmus maximus]